MPKNKRIFISYSHTETSQVESIIRVLNKNGYDVWYDRYIPSGMHWSKVVFDQIDLADFCLVFLSKVAITREQVIAELTHMHTTRKSYQLIALEPLPDYRTRKNELIHKLIHVKQTIRPSLAKTITRDFVNAILSGIEGKDIASSHIYQTLQNPDVLEYEYDAGNPVKRECDSYSFYQLTAGDISPLTIFPAVIDDQWYPDYMYASKDFAQVHTEGTPFFLQRRQLQKRELLKSLLHCRQILVNRSFIFNCPALFDCYTGIAPKTEADAFEYFIDKGIFILFLMMEETPLTMERPSFAIYDQSWECWPQFCKQSGRHLYCLRLDWDKNGNRRAANHLLTAPMYEFSITLCDDPVRVSSIETLFQIPEAEKDTFMKRLMELRDAAYRNPFNYSRAAFYKDFVIPADGTTNAATIDPDKPYALILKKLFDLKYNCNLSDACGCQYQLADGALGREALSELSLGGFGTTRELDYQELEYAIDNVTFDTLRASTLLPNADHLDFAFLKSMRQESDGWNDYIQQLEVLQSRSNFWEVDFEPMLKTISYFQEAIADMKQYKTFSNEEYSEECISLRYTIGYHTMYTVYHSDHVCILAENDIPPASGLQPITIEFLYGDCLDPGISEKISTFITFFRGITNTNAVTFVDTLREFLIKVKGFQYEK